MLELLVHDLYAVLFVVQDGNLTRQQGRLGTERCDEIRK